MNVIVLCEYSGIVRDAFINRGHYAVSIDLLPSESDKGDHHQVSIFDFNEYENFDLVIAHPPCTALTVSGNRWYSGTQERLDAVKFVEWIWSIPVEKMAIENPVGVLNTYSNVLPKPYYVQPWQFGHGETKKTGLWTRNLPKLEPTNIVEGRENRIWKMPPGPTRQKERSRFYTGVAKAMAKQWG